MVVSLSISAAHALSGCAYVEVRQDGRVARAVQLGSFDLGNPEATASAHRWVLGLHASRMGVSMSLMKERVVIIPVGQACVVQGDVLSTASY